MKQLLSLARAFCTDKKLLLLDEPTRSLDKETAETVERLIAQYKIDKTILITTHREEDLKIADRRFKIGGWMSQDLGLIDLVYLTRSTLEIYHSKTMILTTILTTIVTLGIYWFTSKAFAPSVESGTRRE